MRFSVMGWGIYERPFLMNYVMSRAFSSAGFMFACSMFPAEGDLLENIRRKAIDNVRRLRAIMHVLLCGVEITNAWMPGSTGTGSRSAIGRIRLFGTYMKQLKISICDIFLRWSKNILGACYWKSSPIRRYGTVNGAVGDKALLEVWQGQTLSEFNKERVVFLFQ